MSARKTQTIMASQCVVVDGDREYSLEEYILEVVKRGGSSRDSLFEPGPSGNAGLGGLSGLSGLKNIQIGPKRPAPVPVDLSNNPIYRKINETIAACEKARAEAAAEDPSAANYDDVADQWNDRLGLR